MKLTAADFESRFQAMTTSVHCLCENIMPIVGGQPAGDDGLRAFIQHHLKITDPEEAQEAFQRIKSEEMGERPVPSETGELEERIMYGLNVIRSTEKGPFLGSWMIHACFKQAASRLKIFQQLIGTKGDLSEGCRVSAAGISALDTNFERVYLVDSSGQPAKTYYELIQGRVSSPKGSVSISHHSECVPAGTRFEFEARFLDSKFKEDDIKDSLALMMICGLGSVRSLAYGKFRILEAEIAQVRLMKRGEPKRAKPEHPENVRQVVAF